MTSKLRQWSRLFFEYAGAQGVAQVLGFAAGFWLVHLMTVREYALYALALSVLTFLSVFSDLGASSALGYFRRQTRIGGVSFAPYVAAAYTLRRSLVAAGALAGLTFMLMLAPERGFSAREVSAACASLVLAVWIQVNASTEVLRLRLEGGYRASYLAEIGGSGARLAGVAAMWLAAAPLAWAALLAGAAGSALTSALARRRLAGPENPAEPDAAQRRAAVRAMWSYMAPLSLSAAYFSIQAPLTVWLSAYFAGTDSIAEVGALGRLGMVFSLLSGFAGAVLIPRLAAVTDDAHYLRRYVQCWAMLLPFGAGVVAFAYLFPGPALLLLGDAYAGLEHEVVLVAGTSALGTWGGFLVGINNARGWVRPQPVALAVYALIQALLVASLDLSTTRGVLYFGLLSSVAGLALQAIVNVGGFLGHRWAVRTP